MHPFFTVIIIIALLFVVVACSSDKIQGDLHPDIPELPESRSDNLAIEPFHHLITIQHGPEGNFHAFGHLPEDTTMPAKRYKHLLVYDQNMKLLRSQLITKERLGISFVDPQSNLYISNKARELVRYIYPDYKEETRIPYHPLTAQLEAIAQQELRKKGPRSEEYKQLKKDDKEDVIEKNHKEVAQAFQDCYAQQLDLEAIAYGVLSHGKYVLFMKDGAVYLLQNYQGMNGKASLSSFFKKQRKVIIYKHYDREDKGYSIANMMLLDQQKNSNSTMQKRLVNTEFAITEKKGIIENWPNGGYTKGYYYYELTLGKAKAAFKLKGSTVGGGRYLYLLGKEDAPSYFLAGKGWYWVHPK